MKDKDPVILVLAVVVGLLVIAGFFSSYPELQQGQIVGSKGEIKTVGVSVWQDLNLTIPLTSIDWGVLYPSENKTVSSYLRNEGNSPSTVSMLTENWQPTNATNYLSLSWNLEGVIVEVSETLETQLTLTVSPDIQNITSFSFDIILSGSG